MPALATHPYAGARSTGAVSPQCAASGQLHPAPPADMFQSSFGSLPPLSATLSQVVGQLHHVMRDTPLGRFSHWLRRQRSLYVPGINRESLGSPEVELNAPLLPMHLPRWRMPSAECVRRARGSQRQRLQRRSLAQSLTDWVLTVFIFYECGSPKSPDRYRAALGSYGLSPRQEAAAHLLMIEILPFCHLQPSLAASRGRGIATMNELYKKITELDVQSSVRERLNLDRVAVSAKSVQLEHLQKRLPEVCGQCDPSLHLSPEKRQLFQSQDSLIIAPTPDPLGVPKPCYMVSPSDEKIIREELLRRQASVLIPESEVATMSDGRLLLNGFFSIEDRPGKHRLIFDKRPTNAGEQRIHWQKWPLGSMLRRIILHNGWGIRGSGIDLDSFFNRLKNDVSALPRSAFGRRIPGEEVTDYGGIPGVTYRQALAIVGMGGQNSPDIAQEVNPSVL